MGSPEFERMVFNQLRDFGVSVYGVEDTPKDGRLIFQAAFSILLLLICASTSSRCMTSAHL